MLNLDSRRILTSAPASIFTTLDDNFGDEPWLGWMPETILKHLSNSLDQVAVDKVLAVQSVAKDMKVVSENAMVFEKVVQAFCNQPCLMDASQAPYIEEIMYAIDQLSKMYSRLNADDSESKLIFSGDIPNYIAAVGRYHRWTVFPIQLNFAQSILDHLNGIKWRRANDQRIDTAVNALEELAEKLGQLKNISEDKTSVKSMLDNFDSDRFEYRDAARLIGCYLYDPVNA